MNMNRFRFLQTLESIAALLIVVGLIAAVAGLFTYRASRTTADWPSVEGTVTSAEVVEVEPVSYTHLDVYKRQMPNGPKVVAGGSLSPRGDWRMPSDASARVWLEELRRGVPQS